MRNPVTKKYKGWAIDANSGEGHGLIGRYWWFGNVPPELPKSMFGHHIALFETRKKATEGLKDVKGSFPRARVVRAEVTVKT